MLLSPLSNIFFEEISKSSFVSPPSSFVCVEFTKKAIHSLSCNKVSDITCSLVASHSHAKRDQATIRSHSHLYHCVIRKIIIGTQGFLLL